MTSDLNKKISLIQYNELNLPKRIEFQNGSWITYAYDASGVKHKTTHYMMSGGMGNTTTTEYVGNKIFKNGQLDRILTEEGYVAKNGSQYNPYYFLRDHLGSNRVVMNASGNAVQVTNYYPSGASLAESPAQSDQGTQPYKYNGKELDREGGWDAYDYGARMYDPAMGRFMTMDPMAEKYYSVSPYAYCGNNPVNRIDPTGMAVEHIEGGVRYTGEDAHKLLAYLRKTVLSVSNHVANFFGLNDNPKDTEARAKTSERLTNAQQNIDAANSFLSMIVPGASVAEVMAGVQNEDASAIWAAAPLVLLDAASMGKGKAVKVLKPLGLGSTGRTAAKNLVEQMAMREIIENPQLGTRIMEGLKDSRWSGWTKMEYKIKTSEGVSAVVHYVAKWENGVLKAVDDFKFK